MRGLVTELHSSLNLYSRYRAICTAISSLESMADEKSSQGLPIGAIFWKEVRVARQALEEVQDLIDELCRLLESLDDERVEERITRIKEQMWPKPVTIPPEGGNTDGEGKNLRGKIKW